MAARKGRKPTATPQRNAALEAISNAKPDDRRSVAVEQAIGSVRTARAKANYSKLDASTREAIGTGRLVIDRTTDPDVVLTMQSLIERASGLLGQATGDQWPTDDPNLAAAKLARTKRASGAPRAAGDRADVERMRTAMVEYIAQREAQGKRASVTPAAKAIQPTMKGSFSWPRFQQLWADHTGDLAVGQRGDAMMLGVQYGGGDYRARVLVASDGPDATDRMRAVAAAQLAYETEREAQHAEAARVAAAEAKALKAAQQREAKRAQREAAKATGEAKAKPTTTRKPTTRKPKATT